MGRFPRVMPANAGIQDTTTLTEFRLLATPAQAQALRRRVASRWIPAFAGMTKRALFLDSEAKQSRGRASVAPGLLRRKGSSQ